MNSTQHESTAADIFMGQAITQLQTQEQTLLSPSSDFIPPRWDAEVWRKLPSQDKRYLFRRWRLRLSPLNQAQAPALTDNSY